MIESVSSHTQQPQSQSHQSPFLAASTPSALTQTAAAAINSSNTNTIGRVNNTLLNALIANTAKSNAAAIIMPSSLPPASTFKQVVSASSSGENASLLQTSASLLPNGDFNHGLLHRQDSNSIAASLGDSSSTNSSTSSSSSDSNNIYAEIEPPVESLAARVYRTIKTDPPPPPPIVQQTCHRSTSNNNEILPETRLTDKTGRSESVDVVNSSEAINHNNLVNNEDGQLSETLNQTLTLNNTVEDRQTGSDITSACNLNNLSTISSADLTIPAFSSSSNLSLLTTTQAEPVSTPKVTEQAQPSANPITSSATAANSSSTTVNNTATIGKNIAAIGDLPPHWEARVDQLGRIFYIGKKRLFMFCLFKLQIDISKVKRLRN
jgi:hypothetical protein